MITVILFFHRHRDAQAGLLPNLRARLAPAAAAPREARNVDSTAHLPAESTTPTRGR
jgi:hypothetical protein